jgi:polo-like kinase 1
MPDEQLVIEERVTKFTGEAVVRRYERGRLLGKGGFAYCYELLNLETRHLSAVKIVQKSLLAKPKTKQKVGG